MAYTQIRAAIQLGCNQLVFRPGRIVLLKDDDSKGEFKIPTDPSRDRVVQTFRRAIEAIHSRDALLQPYLNLTEVSDQQFIVRLSFPLA